MNKILVIQNQIKNYQDEDLTITNNTITFTHNGDYYLEYLNCTNSNLTINIKPSTYIKLTEYSDNPILTNNNTYNIHAHSNLQIFKFYHNSLTTDNLQINLLEKFATFHYHFSTIATNNNTYNIDINHLAPSTTSNIYNHAITIKEGHLTFNINSNLPKGNHQSILNQETRVINLNNNYCQINPNMYIEEDDVEARHGSVIGNFSHEEIFYLMTRGITYNDAIKLLVKGFIFSSLVLDMDTRGKIFNIINKYWR